MSIYTPGLARIASRAKAIVSVAAVVAVVTASAGTVAKADDKGPIIVVSGPLSWPFFGAVKQGFDDAAAAFGIDYQYMAVTDTANMTSEYPRLLQQAISRNPQILMVGEFFPEGMDPLVKEATGQGIPVVLHNSGQFYWKDNGAMAFIGEDPYQMGYKAGEIQVAKGLNKGLCFNHVPGNPTVEERCKGYGEALTKAGKTVVNVTVGTGDATNLQAMAQAIKGALQANPDVDAIYTLGADPAISAVSAVKDLGKQGIQLGTSDLSGAVLDAIKTGEIGFAMDQQPYLQGYLSMQTAAQYLKFGLHPVGAIFTGPMVIDSTNVDRIIAVNKEHPGVVGAF